MTDGPFAPSGDGQTTLGPDDVEGLIPTYISTRAELYEAEQRNIARALRRDSPSINVLLDDRYLRDLHRHMFGDVWTWAGKYRTCETNIGVPFEQVAGAVLDTVRDVATWIDHATFASDEIAVRLHHRLVVIHPFPNGTGRHSRIAADLIVGLGQPVFSWGAGRQRSTQPLRNAYREALRQADNGDVAALIAFARG